MDWVVNTVAKHYTRLRTMLATLENVVADSEKSLVNYVPR